MKKKTIQDSDKDVELRRGWLAYLRSQGLPDNEAHFFISRMMPVSRATIARDGEAIVRNGMLVTRIDEALYESALLDRIREETHHRPWLDLEAKLRKLSENVFKSIWVFNSSDEAIPGGQSEWEWQMKKFAENSDWLVYRLLQQSKSGLAVGWGETLAASIKATAKRAKREEASEPLRRKKPLTIIPTVGTPPTVTSPKDLAKSSTELARCIGEVLNGTREVLSLDNAWPVLPADLSNEDQKIGFWKAIHRSGGHQAIFGPLPHSRKPLIETVDTILTSAGAFHVNSYFLQQLRETGGVSERELTELAAGDIGSALVPRTDAASNNPRFQRILALLTGIKLSHYQDIARRAAQRHDPESPAGVILCALNGNKSEIVLDLVRHQALSWAIVDTHLANRLKNLLASGTSPKRQAA